jgi:hypothetical protein
VARVLIRGIPPLDTELADYFRPYVARWKSAALDVAAAHARPAQDWASRSREHAVLAKAFATLPAARRVRAAQRAVNLLGRKSVAARLDRLQRGPAAAGGPTIAAAGPTATAGPGHGLSDQRAAELARQFVLDNNVHAGSGEPIPFTSVELSLIRVGCVDETDGLGGLEWGSDEIELGGFGIGPAEQTVPTRIPSMALGDYDDGTVRTYSPPSRLARLSLGTGTDYPKRFFVTFYLVESDGGDFAGFLSDVMDEVRKHLDSIWVNIAAFIEAGLGGLVLTWVVSKILGLISGLWADDHFPGQSFEIDVQSPDGPSNAGETVVRFTGPGEYLLRVQWRLTEDVAEPWRPHPHHDPRVPPGGQEP